MVPRHWRTGPLLDTCHLHTDGPETAADLGRHISSYLPTRELYYSARW